MVDRLKDQKAVDYDQFFQQSFALGRLGKSEDVAHLVVYLASAEAKWTTGLDFIVDGGLSTN